MNDTLELTPSHMVYGGAAFARRDDGLPIFVRGALPGERVLARITADKGRFAEAETVTVLEPSAERVAARCPHFGACGGCQWQHIAYPAQLVYKREIVAEQFRRIARLPDVDVRPAVASPDAWGYRTHITAHALPDGRLGFVGVDDERVVPVETCAIARPPLEALLAVANAQPDPRRQGRIRLQVGDAAEESFIEGEDGAGERWVHYTLLGRTFVSPAGAFFQANLGVTALLIDALLAAIDLQAQDRALDLYAGVGLFTRFLAERCRAVTWVENNAAARQAVEHNLREYAQVRCWLAPVEAALPRERPRAEVVVLDPPRAGLKPAALNALPAVGARTIAYVSCDPSTLARDCAALVKAGYRVDFVQPFDMFPHTYHIESLTVLRRS